MSLFTNIDQTLEDLRNDRLSLMASSLLGNFNPSDEYLESKLRAAEADAQRRLRVFFAPTQVFAGEPTSAEIAALDGAQWVEEAAYDYEPNLWTSEDWGYLVLRKSPVITLNSVVFAYPTNTVFTLPTAWARVDKKNGHVRFVPTSTAAGAVPLMLLSAMSGGRIIPEMIRVRYVAGLRDVETEWPDLVDAIKKMAVLRIIQDHFLPQSGSISADGLSQTLSVDMQAYHDGVDGALDALFQAIHGPVLMVL